MSDPAFTHEVFLSHRSKDKAAVRASSLSASTGERAGVRCRGLHLAERLRKDGLKVWFDEWECPSPAGAGEGGRRPGEGRETEGTKRKTESGLQPSAFSLQPLLNASLAQFIYINWRPANRERRLGQRDRPKRGNPR